jgi:hypothetical protein
MMVPSGAWAVMCRASLHVTDTEPRRGGLFVWLESRERRFEFSAASGLEVCSRFFAAFNLDLVADLLAFMEAL